VEKNEVLPENLEADVQSQDWMYGLKYHSGHMALSPDVQSRVKQGTLFSPTVL
jgi:hypothetical protein